MLKHRDMKAEERERMRDKAREWYWGNIEHVDQLLVSTRTSYAPTGSDILNPALWKAPHWKWFMETYKMGDPNVYTK